MNVLVADPTIMVDVGVSEPVEVSEAPRAEDLFGSIGINATTLAEPLPQELGSETSTAIN